MGYGFQGQGQFAASSAASACLSFAISCLSSRATRYASAPLVDFVYTSKLDFGHFPRSGTLKQSEPARRLTSLSSQREKSHDDGADPLCSGDFVLCRGVWPAHLALRRAIADRGAILVPGARTVAGVLRVLGLSGERHSRQLPPRAQPGGVVAARSSARSAAHAHQGLRAARAHRTGHRRHHRAPARCAHRRQGHLS